MSTWATAHNNVAILGTSADTGYGTTGYPTGADTFNRTTYGWTTRFTDSLHAQWGTTVQNYAHNGALASDYLPDGRWTITTGAVPDIQTVQPDLVIIDLGGNEYQIQRDPAQFQTDLNTLVDNVRAARPGVDILMSIYAQLKLPTSPTYTWAQYATVIYNTAVAHGNALIDMRQYIPDADAATPTNPTVWNTDSVHLNDAGNLAELGAFWGWTSALASIG